MQYIKYNETKKIVFTMQLSSTMQYWSTNTESQNSKVL